MADIHILEGSFRNNGSGSFRIAYHIPVPEEFLDGSTASYPGDYTRESQVIDINPDELEAIKTGTVFEFIETFRVNVNTSIATTTAAIRARWHEVQTLAAKHVKEKYKHYGVTLTRS